MSRSDPTPGLCHLCGVCLEASHISPSRASHGLARVGRQGGHHAHLLFLLPALNRRWSREFYLSASDASMSGSTTGCISSTFLRMNSDRLVKVALVYLLPLIGISLLRDQRPFFQVGGEGGPSTCLAACLAVYPRQSSLGLAVRWS